MQSLLRVTFSVALCSLAGAGAMAAAAASPDPWSIDCGKIDPKRYFGETVANGMIGIASSPAPFKSARTMIAGVYDVYGPENLDTLLNTFEVLQLDVAIDGTIISCPHMQGMTFDVPITRSSWVALRILPSSHTNPTFIEVAGKPIRASVKSAQWALEGVKRARGEKERFIRLEEKEDFHSAYDHAEQACTRLIEESRAEP